MTVATFLVKSTEERFQWAAFFGNFAVSPLWRFCNCSVRVLLRALHRSSCTTHPPTLLSLMHGAVSRYERLLSALLHLGRDQTRSSDTRLVHTPVPAALAPH